MITLNLIPLSELERKSNRFKNTPKPKTEELERFKNFCEILLKSVPQTDNERQVEDKLTDFLATTFYDRNQLVPNVDRKDYVIKSKIDDTIKVIIELKKQQSTDFPTNGDCNKKALHELIKYFFDEKYKGNNQIKTLIATNGTEFYIFEAGKFNNVFAEGSLYKQYQKICSADYGNNTNAVYELARQHISSDEGTLDCIYFDISDYKKHASKLYRLFSPAYLLGEITNTDANDINKNFYNELLHIIGLEERKAKGNKITICRKGAEKGKGSLFELALYEIQKKTINEEKAEVIALQLCIQWINRLLFLKLLETQICKYKESNKKFLDCENIRNFNDLDDLFFEVLGKEEREQDFKDKFPQVPYLNSALFEPNEAEDKNILIRALNSNKTLSFYPQTCLVFDKKNKNQLTTLQYLLKFLDSYDFGSTVNDENADNDKIINASILGRIFEKINGYKDGAVFTPSFITMYMCRETIQKAVIDKFNDTYKWQCKTLLEVKNRLSDSIYDRYSEYNAIINSLKICDPAVGSGHFLVSALNEIIRIKNYLGLLYYKGEKISCNIDIQNDELVISRGDKIFSYDYTDNDSQKIQECLFNEKRTIIENCLFGVDINPNSVNICRLRLWIELLKNTYYRPETDYKQLETLPNIDINIKCGNSLISAIKIELGKGAEYQDKSIKSYIKDYKNHVRKYKETKDKKEKVNLNRYISTIKSELTPTVQGLLPISEENIKYNEELDKKNIYKNSMEWMIEFPEVLDDEGRFCGFDIIIGNPPYIRTKDQIANETLQKQRTYLDESKNFKTLYSKWDLCIPFIELGINLVHAGGITSMIVPYQLTNQVYSKNMRKMLTEEYNLFELADLNGTRVFKGIGVYNCIPFIKKEESKGKTWISKFDKGIEIKRSFEHPHSELVQSKKTYVWNTTQQKRETNRHADMHVLGDFCYISVGMVLNSDEKAEEKFIKSDLISDKKDAIHCKQYIEGKDLKRYEIKRIRYLEYGTQRSPAKLRRHTFEELYTNKKMLINALGKLKCTVDLNAEFYCEQQVRMALLWKDIRNVENKSIITSIKKFSTMPRSEMEKLSTTVDLRYLLGIMNSKYASVLLTNLRGGDYHIVPEHIRNIPIPSVTPEQQAPIIALVDKILATKKADPQADTGNLEHKIDLLVYKLYGLTYQEAKTIDPNLTETKYKYGE